jgi:hypothetical protein
MRTYPHPCPAPAARQHLRIAVHVMVNGKFEFVEDDFSKNILAPGVLVAHRVWGIVFAV